MSSQKNKQRILKILKYLYKYTDKQHPIRNSELVEMFTDIVVSGTRKTIKNDIDVLLSEGFPILETKLHRDKCYFAERLFNSMDISILINAVELSPFISNEKRDVLINKLLKLVSVYEAEKVGRYFYAPDTKRQEHSKVLQYLDLIIDAINQGRKIKYQYDDCLPINGRITKNEEDFHYMTPSAIIWNNDGYYYIAGYIENITEQQFRTNRLDCMYNIEITNDPITISERDNNTAINYHSTRAMEKETKKVMLECSNIHIQEIIDYFGNKIDIYPIGDELFYVGVQVVDDPVFFAWVFKYAGDIRIIEPKLMIKKYHSLLRKCLNV